MHMLVPTQFIPNRKVVCTLTHLQSLLAGSFGCLISIFSYTSQRSDSPQHRFINIEAVFIRL